jgi:2-haloacid dehalogenase
MRPAALIFDVFGTCVDWRRSIARAIAAATGLPEGDAAAIALEWRAEYEPGMEPIRAGRRGYVALDDLHRENLDRVLARRGLRIADPAALARAWERLDPWPDVAEGLAALKRLAIVAPCSNGSIALMTRLARHAGLPWDCILGADLARDYKPRAVVYETACAALRLAPGRVMMVAAHNGDLAAARAAGLMTGFVPRPEEYGPGQTADLAPAAAWDIVAADFHDLADRVGAMG